jgi:hypothetical protein
MVKAKRAPTSTDNSVGKVEKTASSAISASLDYYRAMRDAMSEAAFFSTYGNVFSLYIADKQAARPEGVAEPRELPFVQEALRSIGEGGYPEALARVATLLARKGEPLLLSRLSAKQEVLADYKDLLPDMPPDQWRRVRGEQEIVVRYAPEEALATLPQLLRDEADRTRLVTLVRQLLGDERVQRTQPTSDQLAMIEQLGKTLAVTPPKTPRKGPRKAARKPAARKSARR